MGTTTTSDPLQQLGAAKKIAIADLAPELPDPASSAVRGVVTITWPYSSVKGTFAFILAEPDYRLRRSKGQVRINLTGASAKAAGESGLSSSDEVLVSLDGVEWEPEQVRKRQSLPGAGIDWQLKFSDKLLLQVTLAEAGETRLISIDHPPPLPEPQHRDEIPPTEIIHVADASDPTLESLTPPSKTHTARLKDGEYESPAFIKRARMSYGSLFEDGYDIFEDDGGIKGKGRKRTRFGRESGAWKYSSQSPSPEPTSLENHSSSPPRPGMTDEGCQTMEIDFPADLSVQATANIVEVQGSPRPIQNEEHVARSQHGMVDHGIQGDSPGEWPTTLPLSLPPLSPSEALLSTGPEMPAFQPAEQVDDAKHDTQQGWDPSPRPVDLPPEGYPLSTEPPLPPSPSRYIASYGKIVNPLGTLQPPRPYTHFPGEPLHIPIECLPHDLTDLPIEQQNYPLPAPPKRTVYPPLDLENDEPSIPSPQRRRLDYPPSFLDESRPSSQDETMNVERSTFGLGTTASTEPEPSSWTTVNNPSQATAIPYNDRLGSTEGESIDNAVVIDESDSDDGPPPPTTAEDTVMDDHVGGLERYEGAEVEDEVDAEYLDDDEPEYDADEMGGDYDTRIYTAPDDDEDDSHDEDLRSHYLEPEFDDGASSEGEDEDAGTQDYESEYDMDENDEELREPHQPIPQSGPQVIDLISSSEDEEDEEEDDKITRPQPPSQGARNNIAPGQPKTTLEDSPSKALSSGVNSESEEESGEDEDEDREEIHGEEEDYEEEDDEYNARSTHSFTGSEPATSVNDEEGIREPPEERGEVGVSLVDGDSVQSQNVDSQHESAVPQSQHSNEASVVQRELQTAMTKPVAIQEGHDDNMNDIEAGEVKEEANAPQSAAEGLEILSRVVDGESNANSQITKPEAQRDMIVDFTSSEVSKFGNQEPQDAEEDEDSVDMVSTSPNTTYNPLPMAFEEEKRINIAAPSSPPLTHSFISQPAGEGMDTASQENLAITESQTPADQLPTPGDTQLTGDTGVLIPSAAVSMEVDEPDRVNTTEPDAMVIREEPPTTAQSVNMKQPPVLIEDTSIQVNEQVETTILHRQQTPHRDVTDVTGLDDMVVSPSSSFQTQVGVGDMTQMSVTESPPKISIEAETEGDTYTDTEVDVSGASVSFRSQMEIDDELQASIMEYSQDVDDVDVETTGEYEIDDMEDHEGETDLPRIEDEALTEAESQHLASRGPSPELGTPIQQRPDIQQSDPTIVQTDTPEASEIDPSVQLARAANASRRNAKQLDGTKNASSRGKPTPTVETPTPIIEDASVQLARASLQIEESSSVAAVKLKLVRHLRDELPDYTNLKVLRQYLQKKLDVIAVAMMKPPDPQRAKGGPREFMMSFTITDHTTGPFKVVEVHLYRPHKESLPIVKPGDIVLLRNFTVVSLQNKGFGLRTNDESSWAVFDYDGEPAQIKGSPVEYGEKEKIYVAHMRTWFNLLDEKARARLELANKKIIDAGRSK